MKKRVTDDITMKLENTSVTHLTTFWALLGTGYAARTNLSPALSWRPRLSINKQIQNLPICESVFDMITGSVNEDSAVIPSTTLYPYILVNCA